ncbi:hypothetical protein BpHYR1_000597 [Brachionus plicatilis]|uniref:Uncharacterized protein n=1 Tax=Brachionus plicatilis TaxID=10195 RepID=A0A3M7R5P9_BRAPC|nr:hypothetical protein BpHYR1_000597 [Brachionus plicatilis]
MEKEVSRLSHFHQKKNKGSPHYQFNTYGLISTSSKSIIEQQSKPQIPNLINKLSQATNISPKNNSPVSLIKNLIEKSSTLINNSFASFISSSSPISQNIKSAHKSSLTPIRSNEVMLKINSESTIIRASITPIRATNDILFNSIYKSPNIR